MSEMIYMIKCIKCKGDFNQGDSNKRFCDGCRFNSDVARRKRNSEKQALKLKQAKEASNKRVKHICPVCKSSFISKYKIKKYCNPRCAYKRKDIPNQINNTKNSVVKLEGKIIAINELYEEKMIKLQNQLDYINGDLEKQRVKYINRLDFLKSIVKN